MESNAGPVNSKQLAAPFVAWVLGFWVGYCPHSVTIGEYLYYSYIYIALNRTPNIDCYWVGAVAKV